ncbi:MAG: ATP-binding protein [Polyangiaceae bacterium]
MAIEAGLEPSDIAQILESAPDAMLVIRRDGTIRFANAQAEHLFGCSKRDLIGKPLDALLPERFRSGHGRHLARYFESPTTRPMGSGLDLFARRFDGADIEVEVSLSPVHTAQGLLVSAAIRDIRARKKIEAKAKLNADRLASAVDSIEDPLALFDASDRLVLCNSAYRRLLGDAVSGPLVDRPFNDLLDAWLPHLQFNSPDERVEFVARRMLERREAKASFDVRTLDGRNLRVASRRTLEGGLVQTVWDLTDDVRQAEELRQARTQAEAGSAAKSEFLASMSHELRTPLNAILGFAQLLQRDRKEPLTQRHRERVDHIVKGGEHLLRLIDEVLDLSRIESGRISISTEPVEVVEIVREVETALAPAAGRHQVHLSISIPANESPIVLADRTRLLQILMNLGSNAIKYNRPEGTVTIEVEPSADRRVRVTVADTGLGIPLDKQDKLFQPFQRAGQETGPIEGTGIGLVITKRLAELMQGQVGFSSQPGEGSRFWLEVPQHTSLLRTQTELPTPSSRTVQLSGFRRRVLYVEDNPANVAFMRDLMESFTGIELSVAPSAEIGVANARTEHPHVIIMDINLPGMSGLDALRLLRQDPATNHIPVIALTAAASERDRQKGVQAGFFRYLTKPVNIDELIAALEPLLAH